MNLSRATSLLSLLLVLNTVLSAQTSGTYQIEKSVVSTAGGVSSGGVFTLEFTVGQPIAGGPLQGVDHLAHLGFWVPALSPTAAAVSVGGQVRTASGEGVQNALITLTDQRGEIVTGRTSRFGYFSFDGVRVGETYIVSAQHGRFLIQSPVRVVSVVDQIDDLDFIALEP